MRRPETAVEHGSSPGSENDTINSPTTSANTKTRRTPMTPEKLDELIEYATSLGPPLRGKGEQMLKHALEIGAVPESARDDSGTAAYIVDAVTRRKLRNSRVLPNSVRGSLGGLRSRYGHLETIVYSFLDEKLGPDDNVLLPDMEKIVFLALDRLGADYRRSIDLMEPKIPNISWMTRILAATGFPRKNPTETRDLDFERAAMAQMSLLRTSVATYPKSRVFNAFHKLEAVRLIKSEWSGVRRRTKAWRRSSQTFAFMICFNADGSQKLPVWFFMPYLQPIWLTKIQDHYNSNNSADPEDPETPKYNANDLSLKLPIVNEEFLAARQFSATETSPDAYYEALSVIQPPLTGPENLMNCRAVRQRYEEMEVPNVILWLLSFSKSVRATKANPALLILQDMQVYRNAERIVKDWKEMEGVNIEYLPAETESLTQPISTGIIQAVEDKVDEWGMEDTADTEKSDTLSGLRKMNYFVNSVKVLEKSVIEESFDKSFVYASELSPDDSNSSGKTVSDPIQKFKDTPLSELYKPGLEQLKAEVANALFKKDQPEVYAELQLKRANEIQEEKNAKRLKRMSLARECDIAEEPSIEPTATPTKEISAPTPTKETSAPTSVTPPTKFIFYTPTTGSKEYLADSSTKPATTLQLNSPSFAPPTPESPLFSETCPPTPMFHPGSNSPQVIKKWFVEDGQTPSWQNRVSSGSDHVTPSTGDFQQPPQRLYRLQPVVPTPPPPQWFPQVVDNRGQVIPNHMVPGFMSPSHVIPFTSNHVIPGQGLAGPMPQMFMHHPPLPPPPHQYVGFRPPPGFVRPPQPVFRRP